MKKRITALLLMALLTATTIAGCGKTNDDASDKSAVEKEDKSDDNEQSKGKLKADKKSKLWYNARLDEVFLCNEMEDHVYLVTNFEIVSNMDGEFGEEMFKEPIVTIDGTEFSPVYLDGYTNEYYLPPVDHIPPYGTAFKQYAFDITDVDKEGKSVSIVMNAPSRKDYKEVETVVDETLVLSEIDDRTTYVPVERHLPDLAIEKATVLDDGEGGNVLVVDYVFTNHEEEMASSHLSFDVNVTQNGKELERGHVPFKHEFEATNPETDYMSEAGQEEQVQYRLVYILEDVENDVQVEVNRRYEEDGEYPDFTINLDGSATASDEVVVAEIYDVPDTFEYKEVMSLEAAYSIGHDATFFHLAEITNLTDKEVGSVYYTECYQGDEKLDGIYLSRVMQQQWAPGETYGMIWGFILENETDDIRLVVKDARSYDQRVLFEKTYTIKEIQDASKNLPDGYRTEKDLNQLFDEGVITELD